MVLTVVTGWEGWTELTGSSLAAMITSVAALIAALAAWRRVAQPHRDITLRDERKLPEEDDDGDL